MELRPQRWLGTELRMVNKASEEQNPQIHTTLIHIWLHNHAPPPHHFCPKLPHADRKPNKMHILHAT